jgi:hypothetical protein
MPFFLPIHSFSIRLSLLIYLIVILMLYLPYLFHSSRYILHSTAEMLTPGKIPIKARAKGSTKTVSDFTSAGLAQCPRKGWANCVASGGIALVSFRVNATIWPIGANAILVGKNRPMFVELLKQC